MEAPARTFKALGDVSRLRILAVLQNGAFNVNELVQVLGLGQSRVSRHLKILSDAGLVHARREGTWVYYTLTPSWFGRSDVGPPRAGRSSAGAVPFRRFLRVLAKELQAAEGEQAALDAAAVGACLEERRQRAESFFRGVAGRFDQERDSVQGPPEHLDRLVSKLEPVDTVADLGTGTGILLSRLATRARRVLAVDRSAEMLEVARRRPEVRGDTTLELRIGALEHLPLSDGEADAVVLNLVLHHVAQPPTALAEAARVLRPGGSLLIAEFEEHSEESYRDRLGDLWLGFETERLRSWLTEADLEVEDLDPLDELSERPRVLIWSCRKPGDVSRAASAQEMRTRRADREGGASSDARVSPQALIRKPTVPESKE